MYLSVVCAPRYPLMFDIEYYVVACISEIRPLQSTSWILRKPQAIMVGDESGELSFCLGDFVIYDDDDISHV